MSGNEYREHNISDTHQIWVLMYWQGGSAFFEITVEFLHLLIEFMTKVINLRIP